MKTRRGQYKAPANVMCIGKKGKIPKIPKKVQCSAAQCNQCAHKAHNAHTMRTRKKDAGGRRKQEVGERRQEEEAGGRKQTETQTQTAPAEWETHWPSSAAQCNAKSSAVQCQVQRSAECDRTPTNKALPCSAMQCSTIAVQHDRDYKISMVTRNAVQNATKILMKECAQQVLTPWLRRKIRIMPDLALTKPPRHRPPPATPVAPPGNAPEPPVAQAAVSRLLPNTGARTAWPGASTEWSRPPLQPPRRTKKL
jgi:hypothetical protein